MSGISGHLVFRLAVPEERQVLKDLKRRSSLTQEAHRAFLLAHPEAIDLPESYITSQAAMVALLNGEIAGFIVTLPKSADCYEIEDLFVAPEHMGTGIGRALIAEALKTITLAGANSVEVIASEESKGFYQRCGFQETEIVPVEFGTAIRMVRIC